MILLIIPKGKWFSCQSIPAFHHILSVAADFYRPQWSCGQGNIFTPVCHSVHRGGGGLPHCMLGYHPPRSRHPLPPEQTRPDQTPPGADTPPGSRHPPCSSRFFTSRNEVVAKVIFLHLSVILFTGGRGSASLHAGIPPLSPPDQTPPPPEPSIRSTSGRYASYWNAFLFFQGGLTGTNRSTATVIVDWSFC